MMRIDCPNCGRPSRLPDGVALPKKVRCPACKAIFEPKPTTAIRPVAPAFVEPAVIRPPVPAKVEPRVIAVVPPARTCDFCREPIAAVAKKCRHCGEILDPAMRMADEARRLAQQGSGSTAPVVIHNNIVASATAYARASARSGSSCLGCLAYMLVGGVGLIGLTAFLASRSGDPPSPSVDHSLPNSTQVSIIPRASNESELAPEPSSVAVGESLPPAASEKEPPPIAGDPVDDEATLKAARAADYRENIRRAAEKRKAKRQSPR